MLIAHAPAGYLLTRLLLFIRTKHSVKNGIVTEKTEKKVPLLIIGIFGAVLPDVDFIYHIFIDSARTPHHSYWTHMPFFWLLIWGILAGIGRLKKNYTFITMSTILCLNVLSHLVLDTLTGVIYWFYPLSGMGFNVFAVTGTRIWWVHNFMYHWTFLIEVCIILTAMIVFVRLGESVQMVVELFRKNVKLQSMALRISVCLFGLAVIIFVGSLQFNVDNRIYSKVLKLKQHIVRVFKST